MPTSLIFASRRSPLIAMLLAAAFLAACRAQPSAPTPEPRSAILSEVLNLVEARESAEMELHIAVPGLEIATGGQVKTHADARARLDFSEGSIVRVAPNTLFTMTALTAEGGDALTRVQMEIGKLWIALSGGRIEVETPVGVATVRGSFAVIEFDPGDPEDPTDDLLVLDCVEGFCNARSRTADEDLTNLESVRLSGGREPPVRVPLTDAAVQDFIQNNPEAAPIVVPTLTAALTATRILPTEPPATPLTPEPPTPTPTEAGREATRPTEALPARPTDTPAARPPTDTPARTTEASPTGTLAARSVETPTPTRAEPIVAGATPTPTSTTAPRASDTPMPEARPTDTPQPRATDTPRPEARATDTPKPDERPTDTPKPPEATQTSDRDGDGIPDSDDKCPDKPGRRENSGCPTGLAARPVKPAVRAISLPTLLAASHPPG